MLTIAFISQKGGAGKSTLALHLAAEATVHGLRAVLLDLDPQGSVSGWGERRGDLPPDVSAEHPANLDRALAAATQEGYDLAVIDTAPHADQTAMRVARAADLVLVPCRPATFDLDAVRATLDLCALTKSRCKVVLNAAPPRSKVTAEAIDAVKAAGGEFLPGFVHQRVAFQHCLIEGKTAREYEPKGAAVQEILCLFEDAMACLLDDKAMARLRVGMSARLAS